MMHYKIVAIHDGRPEEPTVYYGTFQEHDEEPCLTALVAQFGEPGKPALECLREWSGGEVSYWAEDMADDPNSMEFTCLNGEYTYTIEVGYSPYEVVRPILLDEQEREAILYTLGLAELDRLADPGGPYRQHAAAVKRLQERLL